MASPEPQETNKPQIEEVFTNSTWQAQAERPGILEQLGRKWDETISTKGHGLKASLNFSQFVEDQNGPSTSQIPPF